MTPHQQLVEEIEKGKGLSKAALVACLRSGHVPQVVLDYAADVIDGKASLKRGRPRTSGSVQVFKELAHKIDVWTTYLETYEENVGTRSEFGTPSERTLAEVRDRLGKRGIGISEGKVRAIVYDFFKTAKDDGYWPDDEHSVPNKGPNCME